ncbi:2-amino-4-hydroxy-6-hydroxymethyldihydropteridine diphosphokinase [Salicola sp. Rm-C-2C1-2]|uniref:2-amino-4-hydroxy-6- hydroxymethyldihydropteridine diphosphokinase n=1 Tax=Salicola sp. Rm-C-2C1-2 TaxID=3141321 RepID=UPI0032E43D85
MSVTAWIGLGSNLQSPLQQLHLALEALHQLPETALLDASPIYRSSPVGPSDQPDFLNMVAKLDTDLAATTLLQQLLRVEDAQGRVRTQTWGPRVLDLDLLLYGYETITQPELSVPHPEIPNRDFVLRPLLDLDRELALPDGRRLDALLSECPDNGLTLVTLA